MTTKARNNRSVSFVQGTSVATLVFTATGAASAAAAAIIDIVGRSAATDNTSVVHPRSSANPRQDQPLLQQRNCVRSESFELIMLQLLLRQMI